MLTHFCNLGPQKWYALRPRDRSERLASAARETGGSFYDRARQTLLTGVAITFRSSSLSTC
jgi:hypothetical protein